MLVFYKYIFDLPVRKRGRIVDDDPGPHQAEFQIQDSYQSIPGRPHMQPR